MLLIFTLLASVGLYPSDAIIFRTAKGRIEGKQVQVKGKVVYEMLGIPFAAPPVGELRFKHPIPPKPWSPNVLEAFKKPPTCTQIVDKMFPGFDGAEMWNPNTEMSEDCLYLNVWVPQNAYKSPVFVWIYGGGFTTGTSTLDCYDSRVLAAEGNVVVVSMQYRIAALGFAGFDHDEIPGNAGLMDQLMALDWIQENIVNFGGDPKSVTIVGESAGSASVSLHLLSPLSRGRFHRAVMQSASALSNWAFVTREESIKRTRLLAKSLSCPFEPHESDERIIKCLRLKTVTEIQESWVTRGFNQFPFVPVIDGNFLPDNPQRMIPLNNFAKVPILTGFNGNEGAYFLIYYYPKFFNTSTPKLTAADFTKAVNIFFKYYPRYPETLSTFGKSAIEFLYTPFDTPNNSSARVYRMDQATGDLDFVCPVVNQANAYADDGQTVFLYHFTQRSPQNPWHRWMGVMHGYEIPFVFGEPLREGTAYDVPEQRLSARMLQYWVNFARSGDPNINADGTNLNHWPRYTSTNKAYLELNAIHAEDPARGVGIGPKAQECVFWGEYLPRLLQQTRNISEVEQEWKMQFSEWSSKYIVEWKQQYDRYVSGESSCSNSGG